MAKSEKLFDMLQLIADKPGELGPKLLAKQLEVSERAVYRYITTLNDAGVMLRFRGKGTELLFSTKVEAENDLNDGVVSRGLQQELKNHNVALSDDASVSVEEVDIRWMITDGGKRYIVDNQGVELNVSSKNGGYVLLEDYWIHFLTKYRRNRKRSKEALIQLLTIAVDVAETKTLRRQGKEFLALLGVEDVE